MGLSFLTSVPIAPRFIEAVRNRQYTFQQMIVLVLDSAAPIQQPLLSGCNFNKLMAYDDGQGVERLDYVGFVMFHHLDIWESRRNKPIRKLGQLHLTAVKLYNDIDGTNYKLDILLALD